MPKTLSNQQMVDLIETRHGLHRRPELSGQEHETAKVIAEKLAALGPDKLVTGLGRWCEPDGTEMGGTGIVAVFDSGIEGPSLMFRAELDGLPIEEINDLAYASEIPLKGHLCGHDGHMVILLGLAMRLSQARPAKGRVILLFQPAEETGKGAKALLEDPKFAPFIPDFAFALHNLPGLKTGEVLQKSGAMCCASRGVIFRFSGKTSHASMPQDGLSPAPAIASLMGGLQALSNGLDEGQGLDDTFKLVTLTHVNLGEAAFGVSPGAGEVWATLRTVSDGVMGALVAEAEALARQEASRHGLGLEILYDDIFYACDNDLKANAMVVTALEAEGIVSHALEEPMRFSEDFGLFGQHCPSSMFLIGSGETQPQLHNPDFDFPDDLIGPSAQIFERIIRNQLG